MKKTLTIITTIALLLSLFASAAASETTMLSDMSENECIDFVKQYNIEIPGDYSEEIWAPFIKEIIGIVEENPEYEFAFNYTATLEFANAIKAAVNDYYGTSIISNATQSIGQYTTRTSSYALQDSTLVGAWMPIHSDYNCYVYSIEIPEFIYVNPGYWSKQSLDLSMAIGDIAGLAVDDLIALDHERVYSGRTIDTTNLCTNEKIICVRRGMYDYHFMKLDSDKWYHKPATSAILKYNYIPSVMRTWSNERVLGSGPVEPEIYYDSEIIYISYDGHDWEYTNNGDGTHTKSCSICGDVFTKNCNLEYTNLTNTRHSVACTVCDYYVNSQTCTYTYTSNEDKTHTVACTLCGNSYSNNCGFTSTYIGEDRHRRECGRCGYTYTEDCYLENTYCGDETNDHVHRKACRTCDRGLEATEACVFAYKSNGENTHVYACTQCRYVKLGPSPCAFKSDGRCRFCGALENSAVINRQEEVILQD